MVIYRICQIDINGVVGISTYVFDEYEKALLKCKELNDDHSLFPYIIHIVKPEIKNVIP
jgi:hypothetical protein